MARPLPMSRPVIRSSNGLPANRESELRDMLAIIDSGFTALAMRDGITLDALRAYQRQREELSTMASGRYHAALYRAAV